MSGTIATQEAVVNGIRIAYRVRGAGEPVLLIMGTGARAQVWDIHQTPALAAAGYRVVTFDNRGMPPSEAPPGPYRIEQFVGDTIGLIEHLRLGPVRVAGLSLGAFIAQELALARPALVRGLALIATRGRDDVVRAALTDAELRLAQAEVDLPAGYRAVMDAMMMLSPQTLNDDEQATLWLQTFALSQRSAAAVASQLQADRVPDRLNAIRSIRVPSLVIGFADDRITPPKLAREVAAAITGCQYVEITGCGHLGHLERPDAVNEALIDFFARV